MNSVRMQGVVPAAPTVASTASAGATVVAPGDFLAALLGALGPAAVTTGDGAGDGFPGDDTSAPSTALAPGGAVTVDEAAGVAGLDAALAVAGATGAAAAEPIDSAATTTPAVPAVPLNGPATDDAVDLADVPAQDVPRAVRVDATSVGRSTTSADPVDGVQSRSAVADPQSAITVAIHDGAAAGTPRSHHDADGHPVVTASSNAMADQALAAASTTATDVVPQYSNATRRPVLVRTLGRRSPEGSEPSPISPGDVAAVHRAVGRYAAIGRPLGAARTAPSPAATLAVVAPSGAVPATPVATAAVGAATPSPATPATPATSATADRPVEAIVGRTALAVADAAPDDPDDGDATVTSGRATGAHTAPDARPDVITAATPATPSATNVAGAVASTTVTPAHRGAAAARTDQPAGLGMVGTDRVDRVRQHVSARPVQRLTVDLDDARIAVRVRGDRVSVDVLRDPDASLGQGWASDVERTLQSAMRAQEFAGVRTPVDRDRTVATGATHDRANEHAPNDHPRDGSSGGRNGGHRGRQSRPDVPWWMTEEDE